MQPQRDHKTTLKTKVEAMQLSIPILYLFPCPSDESAIVIMPNLRFLRFLLLLLATISFLQLVVGLPRIDDQDIDLDFDPVDEQEAQVSINRPNTTAPPDTPIAALVFSGSPGPKRCRGSAFLDLELPRPAARHATPICYNLRVPASCAVFVATKEDGCEARLFTERGCNTFVNLAVFLPEPRAVGGYFRSLSIRCGVVSVEPPPLSFPGMQHVPVGT